MEFNDGTFGQYEDSTGILTGFGESHSFGESLDYAVMTVQIQEDAEGELSFSLDDLVLAERGGTEIAGTAGAVTPITVGGSGSAGSGTNGNGSGSGAAPGAVSSSGGGGRTTASGNAGSQKNESDGGASRATDTGGSDTETGTVPDATGEDASGATVGSNEENGTATLTDQDRIADTKEDPTNGKTGTGTPDEDQNTGWKQENGSSQDPGNAADETAPNPYGDHSDDSTGAGEASHAGGSTGKILTGAGAVVLLAAVGVGLIIRKRKRSSGFRSGSQ